MKKTYTKPEILFEDFSLSTSITAGCEYKTNLLTEDAQCGYADPRNPNRPLFVETYQGCPDGPGLHDSLCYHVPLDGYEIFNS